MDNVSNEVQAGKEGYKKLERVDRKLSSHAGCKKEDVQGLVEEIQSMERTLFLKEQEKKDLVQALLRLKDNLSHPDSSVEVGDQDFALLCCYETWAQNLCIGGHLPKSYNVALVLAILKSFWNPLCSLQCRHSLGGRKLLYVCIVLPPSLILWRFREQNIHAPEENICTAGYPLCPKSDRHQFSSNNITAPLRQKIMTINKIITKKKMPWSFIIYSQLSPLGNVWTSFGRICMWILGLKG